MRIDQTVQHIADSNIRSIIDLSNAEGSQKGIIKAGGNTYNVTVSTDGHVDVSFKGGWFNFLRKDSLQRMQAKMQTDYDNFKTSYAANTTRKPAASTEDDLYSPAMKTARDATGTALSRRYNGNAGRQEIALYGFTPVRQGVAGKLEENNVNLTTIDTYNKYCSIEWGDVTLDKLPELLNNIKSGSLKIKNVPDGSISNDKLNAWAAFLKDNVGKLDVFAKICSYVDAANHPRQYKKSTGWVGEAARNGIIKTMDALVRKNLPGDEKTICFGRHDINDMDIRALGTLLAEIAVRGGVMNDKDQEDILYSALCLAGYKEGEITLNLMKELSRLSGTILRNMFFRQTSKMGLDFFRQRGVPVMFQWTNHQGVSLEDSDKTIKNTWWKDPADSVHNHYGATITFSEMRHVAKMQQRELLNGFDLIKIHGMKV